MSEDDAFVQAILAQPSDASLRLVYADWLEERGDPRAVYLRNLVALEQSDLPRRVRKRLLRQQAGLVARIDPQWVACMRRGLASVTTPSRTTRYPRTRRRMPARELRAAEIGIFLQQYARRGGNDRRYSRKTEELVKRMKPEELDRLIRGEGDDVRRLRRSARR